MHLDRWRTRHVKIERAKRTCTLQVFTQDRKGGGIEVYIIHNEYICNFKVWQKVHIYMYIDPFPNRQKHSDQLHLTVSKYTQDWGWGGVKTHNETSFPNKITQSRYFST